MWGFIRRAPPPTVPLLLFVCQCFVRVAISTVLRGARVHDPGRPAQVVRQILLRVREASRGTARSPPLASPSPLVASSRFAALADPPPLCVRVPVPSPGPRRCKPGEERGRLGRVWAFRNAQVLFLLRRPHPGVRQGGRRVLLRAHPQQRPGQHPPRDGDAGAPEDEEVNEGGVRGLVIVWRPAVAQEAPLRVYAFSHISSVSGEDACLVQVEFARACRSRT